MCTAVVTGAWSGRTLIAAGTLLRACSTASDGDDDDSATATVAFDAALHDELVAMLARDQSEPTGGPAGEGYQARTERLKEIVAESGWPTYALVGEDGEDAAWAIAQHSDHDLDFQQEAVELLREAVEDGQASPGNLAYLSDRVSVALDEPQTYGTQVGCAPEGPQPSTPIEDEECVNELRAEAGLDPLEVYLDEMAAICSQPSG